MINEEQVILVDTNDKPTGSSGKLDAHLKGLLHRAFSVFVFDGEGNLIIQQRALDKYHSPGLWTNTCCSHPRPGEEVEDAAHRRLMEEMGFDTTLKKSFDFIYRHEFENGLVEHEYDHVFIGKYSGEININEAEVNACKSVSLDLLRRDIILNNSNYTIWFKMVLEQFFDKLSLK